jgi:HlyD family secretion protein
MRDTSPDTSGFRRKPLAIGLAVLVVVLGGIAGASAVHQMNATTDYKTRTTARSALRLRPSHVYALGRLEPAGTVLRISPRSGNDGTRVEKLRVREGDDVAAGSIVAVLDNESLRQAALAEAEARRSLAEVRLEQVKAGVKAGDIAAQEMLVALNAEQIRVAERELKRARDLHGKNALTLEQLESKQWAVDRATLDLRRSEQQLTSLREVREVDVRVAERDVAATEAAVRRAQVDLDAAYVRTPANGRILKIHNHEGERIADGGLLELGDVLHMEAVAEVFEADIADLRLGLRAILKVDGLEEPIEGDVAEIGHRVARKVVLTNDPVSDTDARVVEVRIRIVPEKIERVVRLSNARVEVSIELATEQIERFSRR